MNKKTKTHQCVLCRCVLCRTKYPTHEHATLCLWVHIIKKDVWFKKLTSK